MGYVAAKDVIPRLEDEEGAWSTLSYGNAAQIWDQLWGPAEIRDLAEEQLHFRQLTNTTAINASWSKLVWNTYDAVQTAQETDDVLGFLAILGMTLHQVQDFYAHSNWPETGSLTDVATWFDVPAFIRTERDVHSDGGPGVTHDDTDAGPGLNKDYAGRPSFKKAYWEAFMRPGNGFIS